MKNRVKLEFLINEIREHSFKNKELNINVDRLKEYNNWKSLYQAFSNIIPKLELKLMDLDNRFIRLEKKIFEHIKNTDIELILKILLRHSKNSYIVGGCNRDILLGKTPKDYDFVTDIPYEKLQKIFAKSKTNELGKNFLVFSLRFKGKRYEIANFRTKSNYIDGRRSTIVDIGTIEDDRARRDFTINSIYYNFNGLNLTLDALEDIENKVLRFNGNPNKRLVEDHLRGIRFYRFLKTKGLKPDKNSLKAIRRNFEKIMMTNPERFRVELEKIIF